VPCAWRHGRKCIARRSEEQQPVALAAPGAGRCPCCNRLVMLTSCACCAWPRAPLPRQQPSRLAWPPFWRCASFRPCVPAVRPCSWRCPLPQQVWPGRQRRAPGRQPLPRPSCLQAPTSWAVSPVQGVMAAPLACCSAALRAPQQKHCPRMCAACVSGLHVSAQTEAWRGLRRCRHAGVWPLTRVGQQM
jgi:hypothetical protein